MKKVLIYILLLLAYNGYTQYNIKGAEYFVGTFDPGAGNGIAINAVDSNFNELIESIIARTQTIGFSTSPFLVNIRLKDANNNWGPLFKKVCFVNSNSFVSRNINITNAEYFFGTFDPGEGSGTPIFVSDSAFDGITEQLYRDNALWTTTTNPTLFNIRLKDVNNNWGPLFKKVVFPYGVNSSINLISQGDSVTICQGDSLTLTYVGPNGFVPQWFDNSKNKTIKFIPGNQGFYKVTGTLGNTSYSDSIFVKFHQKPNPTTSPSGTILVCASSSFNITTPNTSNTTYQWYFNGTIISNATGTSCLPTNVGRYNVKATNTITGCSDTSANVFLQSSITTNPTGTVSSCDSPSVLIAPMGSTNTYQWYRNSSIIPGATSNTLSTNQNGSYYVNIVNGLCSFNTAVINLSIFSPFSVTLNNSSSLEFCQGDSVLLTANAGAGFSYLWKRNDTLIPSANMSNYIAKISGAYKVQITNNNGCVKESTPLNVIVKNIPSGILQIAGNTSFCSGDSVYLNSVYNFGTPQWLRNDTIISINNSIFAKLSGKYKLKITENGCSSLIDSVIVNSNPKSLVTIFQSICQGSSFMGKTVSGTYIDTLIGANSKGCDSIRTLVLTVNPKTTSTINQTICQGQSFLGRSVSGTYIDTLVGVNSKGCDSIRTLVLSVNPKTNSTINQTICQGQSFLGRSVAGTYIDTLIGANSKGCDSIRTLVLTVNPKTTSTINQTICQGQSFLGRSVAGTYIDTLFGANSKGCDSIRTLVLTVNPKTNSTINQTICQGQSFLGRSVSGTYIDTLIGANSKGCDSIRTLNLTVNPKTNSTINQTICQGQSFLGRSISGTYIDTLVGANSKGCDSIRTLVLTVNPKTNSTINQTICQGQSYLGRSISGTYIDTLIGANSKGCDSIRTLVLIVNPKTTSTINQTICQGQSFLGRSISGTYIDTLIGANSKGCDSIRTLVLTVNPITFGNFSYAICQGQSYTFNGVSRSLAGTYLDTIINSKGCDSILTLNLLINVPSISTINQTICQGQNFLGRSISGTYIDTLIGANSKGCDSIRTLILTVNPKTNSTINQTICQGQSYLGRSISGTYIDTLIGANSKGCDSIRTLVLTVNPRTNSTINQSICQGQSFLGRSISGTYVDTLIGANSKGCDSIRTLVLTVNPKTTSTINQSICQGQSYLGRSISGTYIDTLIGINSNGCDSIRTLVLTVNPKTTSTINQSICQGQSFLGRSVSGTYIDTLIGANSNGCDSIRTLILTVENVPIITDVISGPPVVCQGQNNVTYSISNVSNNPTSYLWTLPTNFFGTSQTNQITINFPINASPGTLSVLAINKCGNSNIVLKSIIVNPKPAKPSISNSSNSLISSSLNGNQWYDLNGIINGANNTVYVGAPNNSYYVVVTEQGCSSDPSNIISLAGSSISNDEKHQLLVFPVPFENDLYITATDNEEKEYSLTTIDGKVLLSGSFKNSYIVNTKSITKGTYILTIISKDKREHFKVVKN